MGYFSTREVSRLSQYKGGVTVDDSLIYKYIISPLCGYLVRNWTPTWLAPNVLTVAGLVFNIVSYALAVYYNPEMNGEVPRWVYLSMSLCILSYMLADNMDGKQAVRTGTSSPLGELVDHGCDSLTIAMGAITTAGVLQGGPMDAIIFTAVGYPAFYMAHWQEYFNHYLDLGMFGPTEAESFAILLYGLTAVVGPATWQFDVSLGNYTIPFNKFVVIGVAITTGLLAIKSVFSGSVLAAKNKVSASAALSQLIPFTSCYVAGILWFVYSPEVYLHPHLFLVGTNLLFSYLVINCIIQRMCTLPYRFFYLPTVPLFLAATNSIVGHYTKQFLVPEYYVLVGITAFYFLLFAHFVVDIAGSFTRQLKINFWSIPYPNKATKVK